MKITDKSVIYKTEIIAEMALHMLSTKNAFTLVTSPSIDFHINS